MATPLDPKSKILPRWLGVLALVLSLAACPKPRPDDEIDVPVVTSDNELAQADFDAAVALYSDGEFRAAADAFRLFMAEHPNDPLALSAEFYLGRCLAADGQRADALSVFAALTSVSDPQAAAIAWLYVGFAEGLSEDRAAVDAAVSEALALDPGLRSPALYMIPGDESLLAALLAEHRYATGDYESAVLDLAVAAAGGDALRQYAITRGTQIAEEHVAPSLLRGWVEGELQFAAAIATVPVVADAVVIGDPEGAQAILELGAEAMWAFDMQERYVFANNLVAAASSDDTLRYGVVLSLTGSNQRAGRAALGSILLAQRAFESEDASSTVIIRDTYESPSVVQDIVAELAAAGVAAIIGPIEADLSEAAEAAAADIGIPYISLSSVSSSFQQSVSYRMMIDAEAEAVAVLNHPDVQSTCTGYIIAAEASARPYFFELTDALVAGVDALGAPYEIAELPEYEDDRGLQEAAGELADAIGDLPGDCLLLAIDADAATALAAHLAAANVWPHDPNNPVDDGRRRVLYVGNSFVVADTLVRNSSDYVQGAVLPFWFDADLATGRAREFTTRFEFTFGRSPGVVEAFAFDAASMVRSLLVEEGQRTRTLFAGRIGSGYEWDGVVGVYRLDATLGVQVSPGFATVSGQELVAE